MAELGLRKYESAQDLHRQQMRTQFVNQKIPKMVQIISTKMHKKLGLVENNQIVENEVANFIHLGAKDFTEVGLRKLEKRIRAMLGQTGNSFKRKSSQRLSRAAEAVLSNRSKPSMSNISKASKTSRHSSVKTVTHSHKSQASGLSMTSRK